MSVAPSVNDYHHSVHHYHSPLPLDHRNRPIFRETTRPAGRGPGEGNISYPNTTTAGQHGLVESPSRARSSSPERKRRIANNMYGTQDPVQPSAAVVHSGVSGRGEHPRDNPLHGSGGMMMMMRPQRRSSSPQRQQMPLLLGAAQPQPQATSQRHKLYNPLCHHTKILTTNESNLAWSQGKNLKFGIHKRRSEPYVTPDEFYDPLCSGHVTRTVPSGFIRRDLPTGTTARTATQVDQAAGFRRGAPHSTELPTKVNWHNPFRADGSMVEPGGDIAKSRQPHASNSGAATARTGSACRSLYRLQATSLMEEVDERLMSQGCGSLLDIRLATDATIQEVLQSCGFSASERMSVLWELRRQYPSSPQPRGLNSHNLARDTPPRR